MEFVFHPPKGPGYLIGSPVTSSSLRSTVYKENDCDHFRVTVLAFRKIMKNEEWEMEGEIQTIN